MDRFTDSMGQDIFGAFSAVQDTLRGLSVVLVIAELIIFALIYFTSSYTLMLIGRKAGETDDWMAYVPVAKDIYKLRFVNAPIWHVFFFGFTGTLLISLIELLMYTLFTSSFSIAFLVIGIILLIGYLVVSIYVTFKYYSRYYRSFGYHYMMAMIHFTPFVSIFKPGFNLYFAYCNSISFSKDGVMPCPSAAAPASVPGRAAGLGRISALNGTYKDAVFEINDMEEVAFGRENPECQIVFNQYDTDVSHKHCTVRFNARDCTYIVTDHSKNGTFTSEDHRLQLGVPVVLQAGTIIFLGSRKNMFRLG